MAGVTIKDHMEKHCLDLADQVWGRPVPAMACPVVSLWDRQWYVVQSVMRGEEALREALGEIGFDSYLPKMKKQVRTKSNKLTTREFVLFNRYVFAKLPANTQDWGAIFAIKEFDCALGAYGRPAPVSAAEVERFRQAEQDMLFDDTDEAKIKRKEIGRTQRETTAMRFPPGSMLRAKSGPFGGFSGMVTNVNGRGAVEAMLAIFGRLTPVEFAPEAVEPIG